MNRNQVIQLVGFNQQNKKLYLTQEGKNFLQSIDGQLSVISIAGLYRTGKSFLVNQMLSKLSKENFIKNQKFQVGSTVQSCTKGLNIWGMPFLSQNLNKKFYYLIVDSQGIGSMEQQYSYDINLLMLLFLISSTVIYNSVGAIDEQSLDQLRVIVNLKKSFSESQANSQPRFIWVLRDFALQLINKHGDPLTENEYLQDCLECTMSTNKQVMKKNEIREAIKQCLPNRQCITLVRPTIRQQELQNLQQLPKDRLRKQFNSQLQRLFQSIFRHQQGDIKYLNGPENSVNGPTLCKMIEYFLSEINSNKVPEINSVWELIQGTRMEELFEQCENEYKKQAMRINLSVPSDQVIKQRLNQIQVLIKQKYQTKISIKEGDIKVYKEFVRFFSTVKEKINVKVLRAYRQIRSKKYMKFARDNINRNIEFEKIDPCQLTEVREVIQAMDIKSLSQQSQVVEYIMGTLFDVMQIAQEKTLTIKNELTFQQQAKKRVQIQRQEKEEQLKKIKHSYHKALKEISQLKATPQNEKQQLQILKQQLSVEKEKSKQILQQKLQIQQEHRFKLQEMGKKTKRKHQESSESIKILREENHLLMEELQQVKRQLTNLQTNNRKQLIFEDKIQNTWDRFEEERTYFKQQLSKYKDLYNHNEEKLRIGVEKQEKLENLLRKQRDAFAKKERQFCEQLKWMKENYSKTKQAYTQSLNTKIQSDKILQDVTKRSRMSINVKKNLQVESVQNLGPSDGKICQTQKTLTISKLTEINEQLRKENDKLLLQKQQLSQKITILNNEIQNLREKSCQRTIKKQRNTQVCKSKQKLRQKNFVERNKALEEKNEILQRENKRLKQSHRNLQKVTKCHQQTIKTNQQTIKALKQTNQAEKQRFYSSLKQLQASKCQQRQIYQTSIMRLLNNLQANGKNELKVQTNQLAQGVFLQKNHKQKRNTSSIKKHNNRIYEH